MKISLAQTVPPANPPHEDGPFLSFVVPVYGSPESLEPLHERVEATCRGLGVTFELILVDDRCPRNSWAVVRRLAEENASVVGLRLSRNFGQHAAIQAGLARARGEWVVVMDCDLQDQPEEVARLLRKAQEGFDVVKARRGARSNDPWHRRQASRLFYALLSYLTDTQQSPETANFGIYHRKVIGTINRWQEQTKYFPAIVQWVGFSQTYLDVEHAGRYEGRSSYNLRKLLSLGVNVIIGFSDKPLKLVMTGGLIVAVLSFLASFLLLVLYLFDTVAVEGWTSIVLSLWFLAGCLAFSLGLTGLYVGRILSETKGRPTFIVDEVMPSGRQADSRPARLDEDGERQAARLHEAAPREPEMARAARA